MKSVRVGLRKGLIAAIVAAVTATAAPVVVAQTTEPTPTTAEASSELLPTTPTLEPAAPAAEASATPTPATPAEGAPASSAPATPTASETAKPAVSKLAELLKGSPKVKRLDDDRYELRFTVPAPEDAIPATPGVLNFKRTKGSHPEVLVNEVHFGDASADDVRTAFYSDEDGQVGYQLLSVDLSARVITEETELRVVFTVTDADSFDAQKDDATWEYAAEVERDAFALTDGASELQADQWGDNHFLPRAARDRPYTPQVGDNVRVDYNFPFRCSSLVENSGCESYAPNNVRVLNDEGIIFGDDANHPADGDDWRLHSVEGYPIYHRNWGLNYYPRPSNVPRPVRGPKNQNGDAYSPLILAEAVTAKRGEQGMFYSRDHVQWAWKNIPNPRNPNISQTWRAEEFLIGGGYTDGAYYGGVFRAFSPNAAASPMFIVDNKIGSVQIFIEGVLNTSDPGWIAAKHGAGLSFVNPNNNLIVIVEPRSNPRDMNIRFLDKNSPKLRVSPNGVVTGTEDARVGVPTPGWRRMVISFRTPERDITQIGEGARNDETANAVNTYRTGVFFPIWTGTQRSADLKVAKEVVTDTQAETPGQRVVDYLITVTNEDEINAGSYRLKDQLLLSPELRIRNVTLLDANTKAYVRTLNPDGSGQIVLEGSDTQLKAKSQRKYLVRVLYSATKPYDEFAAPRCDAPNENRALRNRAVLSVKGSSADRVAEACANLPDPEINVYKSLDKQKSTDRRLVWNVFIENRSPFYPARVRVFDRIQGSPVMQITGVETINGVEARGHTEYQVGDWITIGSRQARKAEFYVEWTPGQGDESTLKCAGPGTGSYNSARVETSGGRSLEASACADLSLQPPAPVLEKHFKGYDSSTTTASYEVVLSNPTDQPIVVNQWVDTPKFAPGTTVNPRVTITGDNIRQQVATMSNGTVVVPGIAGRTNNRGEFTIYPGERVSRSLTFSFTQAGNQNRQVLSCRAGSDGSPQPYFGRYNETVLRYAGSNNALIATACGDLPEPGANDLRVSKVVTPGTGVFQNVNGGGYVMYDITVFNPTRSRQQFSLYDNPTFDSTVQVTSVQRLLSAAGNNWAAVPRSNRGYTLAGNQTIEPGRTQEYRVAVLVNFTKPYVEVPTPVCNSDGSASALMNHATLVQRNGQEQDAWGCLDLPQQEVNVRKVPHPENSRFGMANWSVEVHNNSGLYPARVWVDDNLLWSRGVDILRVERNGQTVPRNYDGKYQLAGNINEPIFLAPGATEDVNFNVYWRPNQNLRGYADTLVCQGNDYSDSRLYGQHNIAGMYQRAATGQVLAKQAPGCADLEVELPKPKLVKEFLPDESRPGQAVYQVSVLNDTGVDITIDDWTDTPDFGVVSAPAGTITQVTDRWGTVEVPRRRDGKFMVMPGDQYRQNPNGTYSFVLPRGGQAVMRKITVPYVIPDSVRDPSRLKCQTRDEGYVPGYGLYNKTTFLLDGEEITAEACADVPEQLKVSLGVVKTDYNYQVINDTSDYGFAVFDSTGAKVGDLTGGYRIDPPGANLQLIQGLSLNRQYTLVETKAPTGYELLASPVEFRLEKPNGNVQFIYDAGRNPAVLPNPVGQTDSLVAIAIGDMRSGDLPESGGRGIFLWMLLGGGLLAAGGAAYLATRRRA